MIRRLFVIALFATATLTSSAQNFDSLMQKAGLVDALSFDSTLLVELKYATSDNFVGQNMYGNLRTAYVQSEIGEMLAKAHQKIKTANPNYRLLILDAARPISVQRLMHDLVNNTPLHIYVSNPVKGGGRHNYGVAVDVTIIDLSRGGQWVDMGSGFDHFGPESHLDAQQKGLITEKQAFSRNFLMNVMRSVGFGMIQSEWWHFQKHSMKELPTLYKRLDF